MPTKSNAVPNVKKRRVASVKKSKLSIKRFIVRKYIMATSAHEALKNERRYRPDDVFIDSDWSKENPNELRSTIGFTVEQDYDDY